MAFPVINPILQFFDNSGNVLDSGLLYTYEPGTTTPKTTYSDENLSVENTNPIVLSSAGRCTIFTADGSEYKYVLQTSSGVTLRTVDEVKAPLSTAAAIGLLLYPRTAAEIAAGVTPSSYLYEELDLRRYGGDPTAVSDSDTAMSNAIAVCGTKGGIIRARGKDAHYKFASSITLTAKVGILIEGEGTATSGGQPRTRFTYSGTGTGVWINMDSAQGCLLRGLQLTHSSASFTGTYIKCGNDGTNGDSQYSGLSDCVLGGSAGAGTTHLNLDKAIIFSVERCTFICGNPSVKGQLSTGGGYSNDVSFKDCTWLNNYVVPVKDPGQSWTFDSCSFEQLTTGAPGAIVSTSSSTPAIGTEIRGCWFGDATSTAGTWIDLQGGALSFTGNYLSGNETGSTGIKLRGFVGAKIAGNLFGHLLAGVDFATATCHGCSIENNDFDTVTTTIANPANHSPGLVFNPNYPMQSPPTGHGATGTTGYEISANGTIRQWGIVSMAAAGTQAVTFTKEFPTACFQVMVGFNSAPGTNTATAASITTSGFTIGYGGTAGAATLVWHAIGN
jgi:hypothetical protein